MRAIGGIEGALRVAGREVAERLWILAAALVAGLLPFTAPLLPGVQPVLAAEARVGMALILAAGFGLGLSLLLGAIAVGRDLGERRLGFDFSRPLGSPAIWAGRFAGALALVVASMLLAAMPVAAFDGGFFWRTLDTFLIQVPLSGLIAASALLPAAHAVGVAFRSRSRWLAVDLVAAVAVLVLAGLAARRLYEGYALWLHYRSIIAFTVLAALALWTASAVQVASGRTDPVRGHRALSLTLWSILLAGALVFQGFSLWVVAAGIDDLDEVWVIAAPAGDWAMVTGTAPGRGDFRPAFLLDLGSGRTVALGPDPAVQHFTFSADGRHAAWLRGGDLTHVDLGEARPAPKTTALQFGFVETLVLSDDGERLAVLTERSLAVYELAGSATLAAVRLPAPAAAWGSYALSFAGPDRARLARLSSDGLGLFELDVASRRIETVTLEPARWQSGWPGWDRSGERLIVESLQPEGGIYLYEGATGALLAELGETERPLRQDVEWLDGGRLAVAESTVAKSYLRTYDRDGAVQRTFDLGSRPVLRLGGEVAPGRLAVVFAGAGGPRYPDAGEVVLLDLGSGSRQLLGTGLRPVPANAWWTSRKAPREPGSAASRLFFGNGELLYLDPDTGALRRIAGRPRARGR